MLDAPGGRVVQSHRAFLFRSRVRAPPEPSAAPAAPGSTTAANASSRALSLVLALLYSLAAYALTPCDAAIDIQRQEKRAATNAS